MKLYITEAFEIAMGGDIKGAFEKLFSGFAGNIKPIDVFFEDLINYLREILGVTENL